MATCCTVHLRVDDGNTVTLGVGEQRGVSWDGTEYIPYHHSEMPDYEGSYEVTPQAEAQTLATANRAMREDLVINPIPSNYGLITWNGQVLTVS